MTDANKWVELAAAFDAAKKNPLILAEKARDVTQGLIATGMNFILRGSLNYPTINPAGRTSMLAICLVVNRSMRH
jgi:hypothetical protein